MGGLAIIELKEREAGGGRVGGGLGRKQVDAEAGGPSQPLLAGQRRDEEAGARSRDAAEDVPKPNYRKLMLKILYYVKPEVHPP